MRKIFTTILSVAAASTVAMAAAVQTPALQAPGLESRFDAPSIEKLAPAQRSRVIGATHNGHSYIGQDIKNARKMRVQAPEVSTTAEIPEIIETLPSNVMNMTYSRNGFGYMVFLGYIFDHIQNGQVLNAAFTMDFSTVYMQDPVSSAVAGTYVKGSFDFASKKVTIPSGQCIMYNYDEGYGLVLASGKRVDVVSDDGQEQYYFEYQEDEDIIFNVADDLSIKADDKYFTTEEAPDYIIGLFWSDDHSWAGYGDYNSEYKTFDDFITTLPHDVEPSDWVMAHKSTSSGNTITDFVKVAVKDNTIYVGGVNYEQPGAYITGTIADGKATFASNQYVGISNSAYLSYFAGGEYTVELISDPDFGEYTDVCGIAKESIVFDYDAEKQTLTAADNAALFITPGKAAFDTEDFEFMDGIYSPSFYYFEEVPATPATPEITLFGNAFDDYGYCGIQLDIPTVSTEDKALNINKLYYEIYIRVDGEEEPFVFYPDEYPGLTELGLEELTEIPYTFQLPNPEYPDDYDILYAGEAVYFYSSPADAYGVKSIYKGGGEVHESPIFWYDTNVTGVENALTEGAATVAEIYGLDGVRRSRMGQGLNIVKMSDGSVRKMMVR